MQNGPEYPISSGLRDWLKLQAQRRGAYHERCRLMRIHVLDELALQLWAHKQSGPGRSTHPRPEMPR
jgi:hypothetical protein